MLNALKVAPRSYDVKSYDVVPSTTPVMRIDRQRWRMLLVEDLASDIALAAELLESSMPDYAWNIVSRPGVTHAITTLSANRFDIALLDLSLQDIEGAETVSVLHAAAPNLPIVIYSGSSNTDLLREAMAYGAQFYIEKGKTEPKLVRAMIQSVLEPEL